MAYLLQIKQNQLYKLSLAKDYINFPINSKMGGCAGQAKNPKEISVYNAQKEAPKVGNDANITNLVENSTEILVNKDNDINPARLPVPDYRFNKNLAATILKSEDLVPKLQVVQVEVLKGEIMPDFEVPKQEENKVHKKLNEFAAVIRNSSKFKEMSHEDGPEGPEAPPLSNHPAVKNHLSENQSQEPKAAPHISSQKQPKLQLLDISLPVWDKQAVVVSSIKGMPSIHDTTNLQFQKPKISVKAPRAIQENINSTLGKLSVVEQESEMVNDQNVTNFALPINFNLAVTVQ